MTQLQQLLQELAEPHAYVYQLPDGWHAFLVDPDPVHGVREIDHPALSWSEEIEWLDAMRRLLR